MKTKQDIINIIKEKIREGIFCKHEGRKALKFIQSFPENATLQEIAKNIDSRCAHKWASHVGDREIMRDRVTDSIWAYRWARDIGDKKIMRERITDTFWLACFDKHFSYTV
jgi:hypothetical protein